MKRFKNILKRYLAVILVITMILSSLTEINVRANEVTSNNKTNISKTFTGDGFTVTFTISSQWDSAFNGNVTITNIGTAPITNWSLMFYLSNEITNIWNASVSSRNNGIYCIRNLGWNQDIAVGGRVNFGFTAASSGTVKFPMSYYIPSSVSQLQVVPESDYKAEFFVDSDWSTGFTGRINLTNMTNEPIKDWKLEFDFDKNISSIWNGTINSQVGSHYIIGNNAYNQNVVSGSAISIGFTGNPGKIINVPTNYTLYEQVDINDCSDIDTDEDGLNNSLELSLGTNAYLVDTDRDGLTDGVEVELGLNPLIPNSVDDTDIIAPSVPIGLSAIELTENSISINWQASVDNKGVCGYDVYINDTIVGTVTTTSYQALNLNPNTTYHFTVTAKDSAGNVSQVSTVLEATTKQTVDTQAPSVPTGLSAFLLTNTTVCLTWNESTDNVDISQYDIYCNDKLLDTVTETSYSYAGLEEGSIYQFYIIARDSSENASIPSDKVSISTTDTQAPTIIADLKEFSNTDTAVTLSWSGATDNVGVTGYKIYRNNVMIADTVDTTYTDEQTELGITYEYMVRAYDAAGNESAEGNLISITLKDTSAPSVPTNLVCTNKTVSSISLKWDASSDNTRVGGYDIYVNSEKVGVVTEGTEYVLSGLMYSTYSITVYAWDENGNISNASSTLVVVTIPGSVMNLNAVYGVQGVTIKWDPVSGVTGYELKINENIIEVGNVDSYTQTQVLPMSQYQYEVRSVNGTDVSEWSEPVSLFIPPAKVDNLTAHVGNDSTIELQWDTVDNAMSYEIEINGMIVATVDTTTYIDSNINSKEANNYRIRAVNGEYKGFWSDSVLKANCVIIKEGTIDQDTVWEKANGCYYVEGNVTVAEGVSLQILPGTLIKFSPGIGMIVEGSLIAEGTEDMPIVFTSEKDPEYGGSGLYNTTDHWREITIGETGTFIADCIRIKDGAYYSDTDNSTFCELYVQGKLFLNHSIVSDSAQQGIHIATTKDITIQNSTIEGSQYDNIAIVKEADTGTVTITNNTIRNSQSSGIGIYGMGSSDLTIKNNQILNNNEAPIAIDFSGVRSSVAISGIFENTCSGNRITNHIFLYGELITDITLNENLYAFGIITVPSEFTLRLLPGVVMLGHQEFGYIDIYGKMTAVGNSEKDIVFTSMKDQDYGGSGIVFYRDYWAGINVESSGEFRGDNIKIRYGGCFPSFPSFTGSITSLSSIIDYFESNIKYTACSLYTQGIVYLTNSEISNSDSNGIKIMPYNDVTILNSTIKGSKWDNICIGDYDDENDSNTNSGIITVKNNIIENALSSGILISDVNDGILIIEQNNIRNNAKYPVKVNLAGIKSSEVFSELTNNTFEDNLSDHICIGGMVFSNLIIPKNTYVIDDYIWVYYMDASLTISPGVTLLCNGYIENHGKMFFKGTEENPITLTSIYDSLFGGIGVTDSSQYWSGVSLNTIEDFKSEMEANYINIRYAHSGIEIWDGAIAKIYNSKIMNCNYGLYIKRSDISSIKYNSFKDNVWAVYIDNYGYGGRADLTSNYWNTYYGPGFGKAKLTFPYPNSPWHYEVEIPEINCPGEKILLIDGGTDEPCDVIYTPYLGSELTLGKRLSSSQGTYAPTGNYSKQFTDLSVSCMNDILPFTRTYNSQDTKTGILGKGWTFNYEGRIIEDSNFENIILVRLPDGSQESFTLNSNGTFTSFYSRNALIKQEDGSYMLTMKDNTKYGFNSVGYLVWIENCDGNRMTIIVDADGKPTALKDYSGRTYTFFYENGLLTNITGNNGIRVNYVYENTQLVKVTNSEDIVTNYAYDTNGYLTEIRNGKEVLIEKISYDTSGIYPKVAFIIDRYGNKETYTYDEGNAKTSITDSDGYTITLWYDSTYSVTKTTDPEGNTINTTYTFENGINKYSEISALTDKNGNTTTYEWDTRGNLVKIINPDGSYQLFTYSESNNRTSERDECGNYTYYVYDDTDTLLLRKVKPLNGTDVYNKNADQSKFAIVSYTFYDLNVCDFKGLMKTITDPEGNTTTYTYDPYGNIETVTDPYGNTIQNNYNEKGQLISTLSPKGELTKYTYYDNGNQESKILPGGETTLYRYDSLGQLIQEITPNIYNISQSETVGYRYTYYSNGELKSITDPLNKVTTYSYDIHGNLQSETKPNGCIFWYCYDSLNRVKAEYVQDTVNAEKKLLKSYTYTILPDHKTQTTVTLYFSDIQSAVTSYVYDYAGRLVKQTNSDGGILSTQYNTNGTVYSRTDARDNTTYYVYDGRNCLTVQWTPFAEGKYTYQAFTYDKNGSLKTSGIGTQEVSLWGVPSTLLTTYFDYDKCGRQLSVTDAVGGKTTYEYDLNGNVAKEAIAIDDLRSKSTEYEYNYLGHVSKMKQMVSGLVQTTTYTYDAEGNLITTRDWLGNTFTNAYDAVGRLTSTIDPYGKVIENNEYDDAGNKMSSCDALGSQTINQYDQRGRLIQITDPLGNTTSIAYDNAGNIITVTDANRNVTNYAYDNMGRLTEVTNAKEETTNYSYDENGNLLTQTDDKGNTKTYTYNDANLPTSKADPVDSNGVVTQETCAYYANGTLKTRMDQNGILTEYTYDGAGKLLSENAGGTEISYTYDLAGNELSMTDETGTTAYTYDELGRVVTKAVPGIGTIKYDYDITQGMEVGCSQVITTDPKGNITDKIYDRVGRLVKVITGEDEIIYTYNNNGSRKNITYSNGLKEEYTYYVDGSLESLVNKKADDSIMDSYTYTYDSAGNQLSKKETINGVDKGTTSYTYDTLNRLSTVTEPSGRTTEYTYDASGNRETEKTVDNGVNILEQYTYDSRNRLTVIETKTDNELIQVTTYTYDNNGNHLTTKMDVYAEGKATFSAITATYSYDYRNQLSKSITQEGAVDNTYNGDGYRVAKTVDGETTSFLYEGDKVVLEVDASGNQIARNVYGINLLMRSVDGESYCYVYNGHSDVTALIDNNGKVAASYYYDAFGNILESSGKVINNIRYSGYQYDKETGQYYLNARMYDPMTARFLQEDTYSGEQSDPLSLNLYTYCINNPVLYVDPTGNGPIISWLIHTGEKLTNAALKTISGGKINTADVGAFFLMMKKENGTYHANTNCWQQVFGYNDLYDWGFRQGTSMKRAKFEFSTENGNRKFIIWAWKGDYINLGAGAELGIYSSESGIFGLVDVNSPNANHWLVDTKLAMKMTLKLIDRKGKTIIDYRPSAKQWWITGFNSEYKGVKAKASNLKAIYTIDFSGNEDMYNAFIKSKDYLNNKDKWSIDENNKYLMTFTF